MYDHTAAAQLDSRMCFSMLDAFLFVFPNAWSMFGRVSQCSVHLWSCVSTQSVCLFVRIVLKFG